MAMHTINWLGTEIPCPYPFKSDFNFHPREVVVKHEIFTAVVERTRDCRPLSASG